MNKIYQQACFDEFAQTYHTHKNVTLRYFIFSTDLVVQPEPEYGTLIDAVNECHVVVLEQWGSGVCPLHNDLGGCGGCPQQPV